MSNTITMPQLGETVTEGTILRWLVKVGDEVKEDDTDDKLDDVVKNLIYKFPTRGRITRARYEMEYGEQNVKTSIYNKKANMIKDE